MPDNLCCCFFCEIEKEGSVKKKTGNGGVSMKKVAKVWNSY